MMAVTASRDVLKIFIPVHVINSTTSKKESLLYGLLFGCHKTICVIGRGRDSAVESALESNGITIILGTLITERNCIDSSYISREVQNKLVFQLQINEYGIQKCKLTDIFEKSNSVTGTMIILYDFHKLKQSLYMSSGRSGKEILDILVKTRKESDNLEKFTKICDRRDNNGNFYYSYKAIVQHFECHFYKSILVIVDGILKISGKLRYCRIPLCDKLCSQPAVCEQIKRKHDDGSSLRNQYLVEPCGIHQLRMRNFLWKNVVDVCLGLLLMSWFISNKSYCEIVADNMMNLAQLAATELQTLLKWMMGVPAGLKLNSQLDQFLGKFFLYHIYLWTAYLSFLKPVLASTLWGISLFGCLGLSVQVALIQDLLSMMTLHIYCFYVYAARLYNFQVSALSSFWRFFRGKKWNALRQRVDSAQYDVDQLFIGTLLFTILLFLLPTAVLYYVMFLGFRLLVLFIQGVLYKVIAVINNTPLYLFLLKICSPDTLINDLEFHVKRPSPGQPYLLMQLKSASIGQLLKDGQMQGPYTQQDSWGALIKKVIAGHLIYPWLDRK